MAHKRDVTPLLIAASGGDRQALDRLLPIVYDELRGIAHRQLRGERTGHTLTTTALVHEAYVKLADLDRIDWQNRAHFFAIAARLMRQILVDYAKRRTAKKRGGGREKVTLDEAVLMAESRAEELLALNEALSRLEGIDERQSRVVECRFFGGMNIDETAEVLEVSAATVKRDWQMARAWLNRELSV